MGIWGFALLTPFPPLFPPFPFLTHFFVEFPPLFIPLHSQFPPPHFRHSPFFLICVKMPSFSQIGPILRISIHRPPPSNFPNQIPPFQFCLHKFNLHQKSLQIPSKSTKMLSPTKPFQSPSSSPSSAPSPSIHPKSSISPNFSFPFILAVLFGLLLLSPSLAFEFDIPNEAARHFGPSQGGPGAGQRALLFADPDANLEDTAGFVSGLPVSARRRLIQPPPLKRAAMEAQRMDWLLAGMRPRAD